MSILYINPANSITCSAGYYGTSSCTKCPSYQTVAGLSASGTTVITGCYISKNATLSDTSGAYEFFQSDCYYKQDSTGGGGACGSRHTVREKLFDLLVDQTGQDIDAGLVQEETDLKQFMYDLGMDSLDGVQFIMAVEQEFDIEIPDDAWQQWNLIGDMVEYVWSKCS